VAKFGIRDGNADFLFPPSARGRVREGVTSLAD
jgi:hypothetical protein